MLKHLFARPVFSDRSGPGDQKYQTVTIAGKPPHTDRTRTATAHRSASGRTDQSREIMPSKKNDPNRPVALIFGASGGIGSALADQFARNYRIIGVSRRPVADSKYEMLICRYDETKLARLAADLRERLGDAPLERIITCVGTLRDELVKPETRMSQLSRETLAHYFEVNAIVPALIIRSFAPLLPRRLPSVFATLSAHVGSISDNRTGSWYGYRASKAALNQIVRTAAIELGRSHPQATLVTLHPGAVATPLTAPYRPPPEGLQPAKDAARNLAKLMKGLTPEHSGRLINWHGEVLPF